MVLPMSIQLLHFLNHHLFQRIRIGLIIFDSVYVRFVSSRPNHFNKSYATFISGNKFFFFRTSSLEAAVASSQCSLQVELKNCSSFSMSIGHPIRNYMRFQFTTLHRWLRSAWLSIRCQSLLCHQQVWSNDFDKTRDYSIGDHRKAAPLGQALLTDNRVWCCLKVKFYKMQ